jgi:hypothetical protein
MIILVLLFANDARADWQYTRWGMTVEQAMSASGGKLQITTASERQQHGRLEQEPGLTGDYVTGDFSFRVDLFFGSAGLRMVSLDLKDGSQAQLLVDSLQVRYGSPQEDMSRGSAKAAHALLLENTTVSMRPAWNACS